MRRVVIESPLSGNFARNLRYARLCGLDCLRRGESPYASHLLFTQMLDDRDEEHRELGIRAGFVWGEVGELRAVYHDLGIAGGMKDGMAEAARLGQPVELRVLPQDLMARLDERLEATPGVKP